MQELRAALGRATRAGGRGNYGQRHVHRKLFVDAFVSVGRTASQRLAVPQGQGADTKQRELERDQGDEPSGIISPGRRRQRWQWPATVEDVSSLPSHPAKPIRQPAPSQLPLQQSLPKSTAEQPTQLQKHWQEKAAWAEKAGRAEAAAEIAQIRSSAGLLQPLQTKSSPALKVDRIAAANARAQLSVTGSARLPAQHQRSSPPRSSSLRSPSPHSPSPRSPRSPSLRSASSRSASPRPAPPRLMSSQLSASPRPASSRSTSPRSTSPRLASRRWDWQRWASPRASSSRSASPRSTSPRLASRRWDWQRWASPSTPRRWVPQQPWQDVGRKEKPPTGKTREGWRSIPKYGIWAEGLAKRTHLLFSSGLRASATDHWERHSPKRSYSAAAVTGSGSRSFAVSTRSPTRSAQASRGASTSPGTSPRQARSRERSPVLVQSYRELKVSTPGKQKLSGRQLKQLEAATRVPSFKFT
eukprot:TRINITY_DN8773_c0_g1_i2.p1 TRINITY_DN8773_c0_g1~~TRINITY_DN8773_c0_g1_i2.p1  ORF type:complete len:535 (+),score=85.33 TRINITY_DN8773_c0_g1_i2:195-1607(+)